MSSISDGSLFDAARHVLRTSAHAWQLKSPARRQAPPRHRPHAGLLGQTSRPAQARVATLPEAAVYAPRCGFVAPGYVLAFAS